MTDLGFDFAGYTFDEVDELSFHHLIIPKRYCKKQRIPEKGYLYWNGSLLNRTTSHDYLHLIQETDEEIFDRITGEMIEENLKGKLDIENLKRIRDLLLYFEREHRDDTDKKGKILIKERYISNRINL